MAIRKARLDSHFVTIPNSTVQDGTLTLEARGLLAFMLSLPDDFDIHKDWLIKNAKGCGRDKMTRILGELVSAGYMTKSAAQDEKGRLAGVDWEVYPTVQLKNRPTVKPDDGKPDTKKEIKREKENTPKKGAGIKPDFSLPEGLNIDAWNEWKAYRKEVGLPKLKPTARGEGAQAKDLIKISGGNLDMQMRIVQQSISKQWRGLFALKGGFNETNSAGQGRGGYSEEILQQRIRDAYADDFAAESGFSNENGFNVRNGMDENQGGQATFELGPGDWDVIGD